MGVRERERISFIVLLFFLSFSFFVDRDSHSLLVGRGHCDGGGDLDWMVGRSCLVCWGPVVICIYTYDVCEKDCTGMIAFRGVVLVAGLSLLIKKNSHDCQYIYQVTQKKLTRYDRRYTRLSYDLSRVTRNSIHSTIFHVLRYKRRFAECAVGVIVGECTNLNNLENCVLRQPMRSISLIFQD